MLALPFALTYGIIWAVAAWALICVGISALPAILITGFWWAGLIMIKLFQMNLWLSWHFMFSKPKGILRLGAFVLTGMLFPPYGVFIGLGLGLIPTKSARLECAKQSTMPVA